MATLMEYAKIAEKVYDPSPGAIDGWRCSTTRAVDDSSVFSGGSALSSGLQARVFEKSGGTEIIVAFKGTVPSMASDLTADLSLALNNIPTQAYEALRLTALWSAHFPRARKFLVGHSLGGAIAQVVGVRTGFKFVTFNAPGMLEQSSGIIPYGMGRLVRLLGGANEDAGVNYRRSWDLVGNFGAHIGRRVELTGGRTGAFRGHGIAGVIEVIEARGDRNRDPLG
jgi:hypothetical protein